MTDHTDLADLEDHDLGLSHDLPTLLSRRRALGLFGGAGLVTALAACSSGSSSDPTTSGASTSSDGSSTGGTSAATSTSSSASASVAADSISGTDVSTGSAGEIPEETSGPYPGDGSNGPNVLTESGIVRSDIRSSFGSSTTTADGIPLTFSFTVVDVSSASDAGKPVKGAAVYAWHCDREGRYSMYDSALTNENYLRGVQETDANGTVTFTSIFPACYSGRWPHIHFEVYPTLADATSASNKLRTSQLAFPKDVCDEAYQASGYEASVQNLTQVSLATDMVFSDGYSLQVPTMKGSVKKGYTATLRVPV